MTALPIPDFELESPQALAALLAEAETWREVEGLTQQYSDWKVEAWKLLSEPQMERLKLLQQWQHSSIAQKFPPGATVQRLDDQEEGLIGEVKTYWQAYGIDYVTFLVGPDVDWCRASNLKRVAK